MILFIPDVHLLSSIEEEKQQQQQQQQQQLEREFAFMQSAREKITVLTGDISEQHGVIPPRTKD